MCEDNDDDDVVFAFSLREINEVSGRLETQKSCNSFSLPHLPTLSANYTLVLHIQFVQPSFP